MRISPVRFAMGGLLLLFVLGSGPCPACYDDECSPRGKTWCSEGIAYYCDEYTDNSAYGLFEDDCAAAGLKCVVLDEREDYPGPVATCVPDCPDGGLCPDGGIPDDGGPNDSGRPADAASADAGPMTDAGADAAE